MRITVENIYKNASYSYSELFSLISLGFVIGFLFSFDNWGLNGVYDRTVGLSNLLLYSIASIFVIFLFTYIQKIIAVYVGVSASHRISWIYLLVSVLLCFVTSGKFVFFIPPTLHISQKEHLSIGRKPLAFSIKNLRLFALLPILGLIFVAVIISEILPLAPAVSSVIYWVSFFTALYSLIPIEFLVNIPLSIAKEKAEVVLSEHTVDHAYTSGVSLGSILFYGSRMNLVFALAFLVASLISQITSGFLFTLLFSFCVGLCATIIYFVKVDSN